MYAEIQIKEKSKRYPYYASWLGISIDTHTLELPLSWTYFHGSKNVREPMKLYCMLNCKISLALRGMH